jgi:membrane protease subunit (stomatin/prohibitin family)
MKLLGGVKMGLFDFIKGQFIEVIDWQDNTTDTMVYKVPVQGNEIKMGAKLTVRESQIAIFVNEGQIADVFTPGLYELSTENMPIFTKLESWKYGFNSPFKADVYFVNTKQFIDQKWGTINPVMMRDAEFGMLRLRAIGIYSFRITDSVKFLKEIFGTSQLYDTESITGQLKRIIVSGLTDILGEMNVPALDLARYYNEIGVQAKTKLQEHFEAYGLNLTSFFIENISLPEEVEKMLDKRTSMGVIGNMQQYAQFQAAEALRDAAQNQGSGFAGMGAGLGAGAVLGNIMGEALKIGNQQNNQYNNQQNQQNQQAAQIVCPTCKALVPSGQKFCSSCGSQMTNTLSKCIKCNAEIPKDSKFCPECGNSQISEALCGKCGAKLTPGVKFCPECGNKNQ